MKFKLITIITILCLSLKSYSADLDSIKYEFQRDYVEYYQEGQCGLNIDNFVKRLNEKKIDIKGVILVLIDGGGDLRVYSARSYYGEASTRGWYQHYIMLVPSISGDNNVFNEPSDLLKYYVIDFDFLNQPTIVNFKSYLEKMYMSPDLRLNRDKIAKNIDLGLMKFDIIDAVKYLKVIDSKNPNESRQLKRDSVIEEGIKFRSIY